MPRAQRTTTTSRSGASRASSRAASPRARSTSGLVTAVVAKPRDPSLVEVSVDDAVVGIALRSAVESLKIREGTLLTAAQRTALAAACERATARTLALKALGRSDRSRASLITLLTERHAIGEAAATAVIDELAADGWQDDRRYAEHRARRLAESTPCSEAFVSEALTQEGIDQRLANRMAKAAAPAAGDAERALAVAREALRAAAGSRGRLNAAERAKARRRVGQLLARRGFDPDTMETVLARLGLMRESDGE